MYKAATIRNNNFFQNLSSKQRRNNRAQQSHRSTHSRVAALIAIAIDKGSQELAVVIGELRQELLRDSARARIVGEDTVNAHIDPFDVL